MPRAAAGTSLNEPELSEVGASVPPTSVMPRGVEHSSINTAKWNRKRLCAGAVAATKEGQAPSEPVPVSPRCLLIFSGSLRSSSKPVHIFEAERRLAHAAQRLPDAAAIPPRSVTPTGIEHSSINTAKWNRKRLCAGAVAATKEGQAPSEPVPVSPRYLLVASGSLSSSSEPAHIGEAERRLAHAAQRLRDAAAIPPRSVTPRGIEPSAIHTAKWNRKRLWAGAEAATKEGQAPSELAPVSTAA
jgi:hypothetical protein